VSIDCEPARRHLGAVHDREAHPDPMIDDHVEGLAGCRTWLADVDEATRALSLRTLTRPTFVDTLDLWVARARHIDDVRRTAGRLLLGVAAVGCLVVGIPIAVDSVGHTLIGVTAHREEIILAIALARRTCLRRRQASRPPRWHPPHPRDRRRGQPDDLGARRRVEQQDPAPRGRSPSLRARTRRRLPRTSDRPRLHRLTHHSATGRPRLSTLAQRPSSPPAGTRSLSRNTT
jgi:hypothetical protein